MDGIVPGKQTGTRRHIVDNRTDFWMSECRILFGKRNLGNTMYIKAGTVKVEALRSSITRFLPIFTGVPTYLAQVYLQESPRTTIPTTAIHSPPHHRQRAQQRRCAVSMAIGIPRHKLDLGVFEHKKHLLALQSPSSHKITRPLLPSPSRSEFAVVWASVGAFGNIPHQSRRSQGGSICLSFFHGKRGRH